MLLRANALAKGYSGARIQTVELLVECLNRGVLPHVPSRGSVGASGDLAPLAHLALPLIGEGEATVDGRRLSGARHWRKSASSPVRLQAKEGLSLVNGTQFMAAFGALGIVRARRLAKVADIACAQSLEALQGSRTSFSAAGARPAPAPGPDRLGGERAPAARGLRHQRVPPLVRQGPGRVLAALRARRCTVPRAICSTTRRGRSRPS
jgi:histidine ammonia-lyase